LNSDESLTRNQLPQLHEPLAAGCIIVCLVVGQADWSGGGGVGSRLGFCVDRDE